MECNESRNKISLLIWDDIPFPEDLTLHLNGCDACTLFHSNYLAGIKGMISDKRIKPDSGLWHKINNAKQQEVPVYSIPRLALTGISAAAALFTGLTVANLLSDTVPVNDKELYKQEVSVQSTDISGINDGLIEYYNFKSDIK
jgi:hypothetical protein